MSIDPRVDAVVRFEAVFLASRRPAGRRCARCVAHCDRGVLMMVDGKALIDLRHLNKCDLDGECVEVCPTDVITLLLQPAEKAKPEPQKPAVGA